MVVILAASKICIALRKSYCTGQNDVQTIYYHSADTNLLIEKRGKRYEVLARLYLSGAWIMVEHWRQRCLALLMCLKGSWSLWPT